MQQAQTEMDAQAAHGRAVPRTKDWGVRLQAFYHWFVQDTLRTALIVLRARRPGVIDCPRQCGEPAIGACGRGRRRGNCRAHGVGRRTRPHARATSHRKSAACLCRRRRWITGGAVDRATDEPHASAGPVAGAGGRSRYHGVAVRAGHHSGHRHTVRLRTRLERCQRRPEYGAEAGRPGSALRAANVGAPHSCGRELALSLSCSSARVCWSRASSAFSKCNSASGPITC